MEAEAEKQQTELKADADLKVAMNNAQGIEAEGKAKAESTRLMKNAEVSGDITLSKEIGENKEYQDFVLKQKQIDVMGEVGKEQARNLAHAEIKIFANGNDVSSGINQAANVFSPKNGLNFASMLEAFGSTDIGSSVIEGLLSKLKPQENEVKTTVDEVVNTKKHK